ncbi:MAG: hydroxymethylbilane synthase [Candidatus Zixiibacteriota bacterium]
MKKLTIGTRGSDLALWQANFIKRHIEERLSTPVDIKIIKTQGDKIQHLSFEKMEGKGFFTKEIEDSLLDGSVDLAVHSLKDLQTTMPPGLALTAVGFREDNREAILIRRDSYDSAHSLKIKFGGIIGSSSVRRQSQIAHIRPDLHLKDLRGNVPTRVNKLRDGLYDGIVIAYAGLKRLELDLSDIELLIASRDEFLPAPAQGILGLQTRSDDAATNELVKQLDDPHARTQVNLERGLMKRFDGGCQLPLGAYSEVNGGIMRLKAALGIRDLNKWVALKIADISGENVQEIVDKAFAELSEPA